jgi:hypothetical protein
MSGIYVLATRKRIMTTLMTNRFLPGKTGFQTAGQLVVPDKSAQVAATNS